MPGTQRREPQVGDAIAPLTEFFGAEDLVFCCRARWALGEIGSAAKRLIPALMRMLTPQHDRFAFEAIQKIGPKIAERFMKESIARGKPGERRAKSAD